MEFLIDLWLPILLSTIALFFASTIAWTVLPHHFGDFKQLPDEDSFTGVLRNMELPPGNYMFPYCQTKSEQGSPEYAEKYTNGPRGTLNVWEMPNMGINLGLTVLFFLVTTTVIAYVTHVACPPAADSQFMKVLRIAGTIGILVHASSGILNAIWFRKRMSMIFLDGIAYGLIIGLIFAWLWPTV